MKKLFSLGTAIAIGCTLLLASCASAKSAPVSVHPRDYTFDMIDGTSNGSLDIVYNQYGPNYQGKLDYSTRTKKDLPQAGDTVYIKGIFTSDIDLPVLFGCLVDPSQAANYWTQLEEYATIAENVVAGEPVEIDLEYVLTAAPIQDFTFMLQYDTSDQAAEKIGKPAKLTFERVCESTDTRNEVPSAPHEAEKNIYINDFAALVEFKPNHPWENGVEITSVLENYRANPNITSAWNGDLPVAGDVINVTWKGVADADIEALYIYVVDQSEQAAWWKELSGPAILFAENIKNGEPFEASATLPLTADPISQVNLIIQYDVGAATPDGAAIVIKVRE